MIGLNRQAFEPRVDNKQRKHEFKYDFTNNQIVNISKHAQPMCDSQNRSSFENYFHLKQFSCNLRKFDAIKGLILVKHRYLCKNKTYV